MSMWDPYQAPPDGAHIYDMLIVGGGPGGYTAALYAARAGLDTLILEKLSAGGQMALSGQIDNYPGFDTGIEGFLLGEKMQKGAERFGAKTRQGEVISAHLSPPIKQIHTAKETLYGKTVLLATGANPKKLGIAGEAEWIGRGISYCASCDGMFYRNKTVVVVGGGNSAAENALTLSRLCRQVILVHIEAQLQATKIYQTELRRTDNITIRPHSTVSALLSDTQIRGVRLHDRQTGGTHTVSCEGVFISIGRVPATEWIQGQVATDAAGYILADETTCTDIPGVFAVGDVRTKTIRQIVTAVADGAVAVHYAEAYLTETGQ